MDQFVLGLVVGVFVFGLFTIYETVPKHRYKRLAKFLVDKGLFEEYDKELEKLYFIDETEI